MLILEEYVRLQTKLIEPTIKECVGGKYKYIFKECVRLETKSIKPGKYILHS